MNPIGKDWCMNGHKMKVWVDVSSLAMRMALEVNRNITEDASWLRLLGDAKHIKLTFLDTIIKGINMALQWQLSLLYLMDSACVHPWISNTLTGMMASGKMLVKQWLETF